MPSGVQRGDVFGIVEAHKGLTGFAGGATSLRPKMASPAPRRGVKPSRGRDDVLASAATCTGLGSSWIPIVGLARRHLPLQGYDATRGLAYHTGYRRALP